MGNNCTPAKRNREDLEPNYKENNKNKSLRFQDINITNEMLQSLELAPFILRRQNETNKAYLLLVSDITSESTKHLFLIKDSSIKLYRVSKTSIKLLEYVNLHKRLKEFKITQIDPNAKKRLKNHLLSQILNLDAGLSFNAQTRTLTTGVLYYENAIISLHFEALTLKLKHLEIREFESKHRFVKVYESRVFQTEQSILVSKSDPILVVFSKRAYSINPPKKGHFFEFYFIKKNKFEPILFKNLTEELENFNPNNPLMTTDFLKRFKGMKIWRLRKDSIVAAEIYRNQILLKVIHTGLKKLLKVQVISKKTIKSEILDLKNTDFEIVDIFFDSKSEAILLFFGTSDGFERLLMLRKPVYNFDGFDENGKNYCLKKIRRPPNQQCQFVWLAEMTIGWYSFSDDFSVNVRNFSPSSFQDASISLNHFKVKEGKGVFQGDRIEFLALDSDNLVVLDQMKVMIFNPKLKTVNAEVFHTFFELDKIHGCVADVHFFGDFVVYPTKYAFHILRVSHQSGSRKEVLEVGRSIYLQDEMTKISVDESLNSEIVMRHVVQKKNGNFLLIFNSHFHQNSQNDKISGIDPSKELENGQESRHIKVSEFDLGEDNVQLGVGLIEIEAYSLATVNKQFCLDPIMTKINVNRIFEYKSMLVFIIHPDEHFKERASTIAEDSANAIGESKLALANHSLNILTSLTLPKSSSGAYFILQRLKNGVIISKTTNHKNLFFYQIDTKNCKIIPGRSFLAEWNLPYASIDQSSIRIHGSNESTTFRNFFTSDRSLVILGLKDNLEQWDRTAIQKIKGRFWDSKNYCLVYGPCDQIFILGEREEGYLFEKEKMYVIDTEKMIFRSFALNFRRSHRERKCLSKIFFDRRGQGYLVKCLNFKLEVYAINQVKQE